MYCVYYRARIDKSKTWFFVATLRSFEHLCFDRTIDVDQGMFEFFVPPDNEAFFVQLMHHFQNQCIAYDLEKVENRLLRKS